MKPLPLRRSPLSSPTPGNVTHSEMDSSSDGADYQCDDEGSNIEDSPVHIDDDSDISQEGISKSDDILAVLSKRQRYMEVPSLVLCFWCKKVCPNASQTENEIVKGTTFPLTSGDKYFCSEVCFNQCRRASFKKSKICDWCRQVKPTVSYVDFTDGKDQIQFCSDNCSNQYKMHIFCRETEAHLQFHPHLNEVKDTEEGALITPDMWLKNCSLANAINASQNHDAKINEALNGNESENDSINPSNKDYNFNTSRFSSGSSTRETSPTSFFDNSEPVNLSISQFRTARSPNIQRKENRKEISLMEEESSVVCASNHHIKPLSEVQSIQDDDSSSRKVLKENIKGKIRVRQLEGRKKTNDYELNSTSGISTSSSSAPSSTTMSSNTSPAIAAGLTNLLLNGGQPHFFPTLPNLFPQTPSDFPPVHHQILPQLLLNSDHLKLPHIRPPFILPHPSSFSPIQQPAPIPPPVSLSIQPSAPQATVLLPCPLPIPIPVPIPIPFPVPVDDFNAVKKKAQIVNSVSNLLSNDLIKMRRANKQNANEPASTSSSVCASKNINIPLKEEDCKEKSKIQTTKTAILAQSLESIASKNDVCPADENPSHPNASVKNTDPHSTRKERRSILQYTSDVYEINGVFVPKEGTWLSGVAAPAPSINSINKRKEIDSGTNASHMNGTSATIRSIMGKEKLSAMGENPHKKFSNNRVRATSHDKHGEPLPKKKHLYV